MDRTAGCLIHTHNITKGTCVYLQPAVWPVVPHNCPAGGTGLSPQGDACLQRGHLEEIKSTRQEAWGSVWRGTGQESATEK